MRRTAPNCRLDYGRSRRSGVTGDHVDADHVRTEQTWLVGRLVGSGAAQRSRAVGGEHDEGLPDVVRLEHGRVKIGDGRARRRQHGNRAMRSLGQAQGEEAGRALVDPHVQPQPPCLVGSVQSEGERCGPRAGGEHDLPDAGPQQGAHDGLSDGGGGVHD